MTLAERYDRDINESVAQLEQLLILLKEVLEEIPNAGFPDDLTEILDRLNDVIKETQQKRLDFGRKLRELNL